MSADQGELEVRFGSPPETKLTLPLERGCGQVVVTVRGEMAPAEFDRLLEMLERCRGVLQMREST